MRTIRHDSFGIGCPNGWYDASLIILSGPTVDNFGPTITVARKTFGAPQTARTFGESQLSGLQEYLADKGLEIIEEGVTSLGGLDAYQRIFRSFHAKGDFKVMQMQVYLVHVSTGFIITATDRNDTFMEHLPIFQKAIHEFHFT